MVFIDATGSQKVELFHPASQHHNITSQQAEAINAPQPDHQPPAKYLATLSIKQIHIFIHHEQQRSIQRPPSFWRCPRWLVNRDRSHSHLLLRCCASGSCTLPTYTLSYYIKHYDTLTNIVTAHCSSRPGQHLCLQLLRLPQSHRVHVRLQLHHRKLLPQVCSWRGQPHSLGQQQDTHFENRDDKQLLQDLRHAHVPQERGFPPPELHENRHR